MSGRGPTPDRRRERGGPQRVIAEDLAEKKTLPIGGWILVLTGKHKGEDYRLREGKNSVGSDPSCEVLLSDDTVSAKHAVITCKRSGETSGAFTLVDLDSTNGTFHNDEAEQIRGQAELVDNDVIVFGKVRCKFMCT